MKNILIIDQDPVMLQTLAGLLKSQGGLLNVLTVSSSQLAVKMIEKQRIDIVVAGLRLPEIDGFKLVAMLSKEHPSIRVIVMTSNASPMFRAQLKQVPSAIHFDQTTDLSLLTKRIFTELQINYGGQVRGIHLSSFLQMIELEERTCSMQINAKGKSGILYVDQGALVDAQNGPLEGKEAALQILTWENVVIDLDYSPVNRPRKITIPLMGLLIESGRMIDESKSDQKNKRNHDRYDCLVAVDYDISDFTYHCFLRDISLGGAYVETEQQIAIGQKIVLTISAPNLPHSSIEGQVVRRDDQGIGIRFESLNSQQEQIISAMTHTSDPQAEGAD